VDAEAGPAARTSLCAGVPGHRRERRLAKVQTIACIDEERKTVVVAFRTELQRQMLRLDRLDGVDPEVGFEAPRDVHQSPQMNAIEIPVHRAHDHGSLDPVLAADLERLQRLTINRGTSVRVVLVLERTVEAHVDVVEELQRLRKVPHQPRQRNPCGRQPNFDARSVKPPHDVRQQAILDPEPVGEQRLVAAKVHGLDAVQRQLFDNPVHERNRERTTVGARRGRVAVMAVIRAVVAERPPDVADVDRALLEIPVLLGEGLPVEVRVGIVAGRTRGRRSVWLHMNARGGRENGGYYA
jgi:hypothetical protein